MGLLRSLSADWARAREVPGGARASSAPDATLRPYHAEAERRRQQRLAVAFAAFCVIYGFAFAVLAPGMIGILVAPAAILAGLVIWALPDVAHGPVGPIRPLYFAYFAAMIMWPNYIAIALPGLPWITLLRLIGFPLAALMLISLSMSRSFRSQMASIINSASPIWRMITLFVVVQFATLIFSEQVGYSMQYVIISQVNWTLIFFAGCYVFSEKGRTVFWAALTWATAVWTSIIGVIEQREGQPPWVGHIPSFLKVDDPLIDLILKGGERGGVHRVQATFGTSLNFAEYLALAAPFVLHFMLGRTHMLVRVAAAATMPLLLYAVLITQSRLGVIGVILGSLTYLLFWAGLRWRRDRKSVIGPAVSLTYPVIFALAGLATVFVHRLHAVVWGNGLQDDSNAGRATEWTQAIPKILANPIGHGAGTGGFVLNFLEVDGRPTIDSYYLSVALEYGVLGLILYYGVICYAIYLCAKLALVSAMHDFEDSLLAPIAASMAAFLFTKSVLSEIDNNGIVFALMSMVVAQAYRSRSAARGSANVFPSPAGASPSRSVSSGAAGTGAVGLVPQRASAGPEGVWTPGGSPQRL